MVGFSMAIEKKWLEIPVRLFTMDGTSNGLVTLSTTSNLKVKQTVLIKATGEVELSLEIKRVISSTQLYVGFKGRPIGEYADLSAYTTAKNSYLRAPEQNRPAIPATEHERAVYEEEPTVAKRVFVVDKYGDGIDEDNPFPVLATISDNAPKNRFTYRKIYTTANIENSQVLPENTKKLYVNISSDKKARLKVSLVENGTIDNMVNDYITLEVGCSYFREGLRLTGKTLYYQANRDNLVIEIEAWV